MMELLADPQVWLSFGTLAAMEIVLGIDNIVFITILCGRLPEDQQPTARRIGIGVALVSRLALLGAIGWVLTLEQPLFEIPIIAHTMSGKELILLLGGLFLLGKATTEIYENVERPDIEHLHHGGREKAEEATDGPDPTAQDLSHQYLSIVGQVLILDLVFSIDSVITAVGMSDHIEVMVAAMVVAVAVMMIFAGPIGDFIQKTPSVRMLALAFLILIGAMLVMEGTGQHVSKGYIYSAMGFSLFVELINLRRRRNVEEVSGGAEHQEGE